MFPTRLEARSLEEDIATINYVDTCFILICTFGVFIITPGIGMFYGGMLRRKNILSILFQSYIITAVITIQWYLFGYSLAVSPTANSSILGNFHLGALQNFDGQMFLGTGTVPEMLYFIFSTFFPVCTVQIFVGAIAERGRLLPSLVIGIIWTTVVYCPQAYWVWNAKGWLYNLGSLDFAGGGPVHISSGMASLAYSLFIGKRKDSPKAGIAKYRPKDPVMVFIGATLIWFGWFAFNSGTGLAVNLRTTYIAANTHIAASAACATWVALDKIMTGRFSITGACEGAIAGLVAITPACAYVAPWAAFLSGAITAAVCRLSHKLTHHFGIDDTIEAFNLHGVGGIVGGILLGFFASPNIAGLDGVTEIAGGWVAHHWKQLGYQLADICAISLWSFTFTYIICFGVNYIPGLHLRVTDEEEVAGLDMLEIYEVGGAYDEEPEIPSYYGQAVTSSGAMSAEMASDKV